MLKGLKLEIFEPQKNLILNAYNFDTNFYKLVDQALFPFLKSAASKVKSYLKQPNSVNGDLGSWFDPSRFNVFFIDIKSFRSHYGPGVDSASNRNEYQGYFLGVKAAGA